MRRDRALLREYITGILKEAAANPKGLALGKFNQFSETALVLWDPNAVLEELSVSDTSDPDRVYKSLVDRAEEWVVGIISLNPKKSYDHWGGAEVKAVAARQGYGPAMYDLAMGLLGTIYPDREQVSRDAERVWNFYDKSRGDVEKLPFDDIKNPQTPPREDDSELHHGRSDALNKAYTGKGTPAKMLMNKHEYSAKLVADEMGWDVERVKLMILNAGREYFEKRYW